MADHHEHARLVAALAEGSAVHQLDVANQDNHPCCNGENPSQEVDKREEVEQRGHGIENGAHEEQLHTATASLVKMNGEFAFPHAEVDECRNAAKTCQPVCFHQSHRDVVEAVEEGHQRANHHEGSYL